MSVLFPAYLVGLLGLALPWLLHRFSDQQPEEQLFPSRQFLEPTAPPVSRTRTLKYRALLALRVLSVILLSLLFAQPWLKTLVNDAQPTVHHVISVDQSFSMRSGEHWSRALEREDTLIDELPETDSIELVSFAQSLQRVADDQESTSVIRRALATLEPMYTAADYGVLMQRLNQLAAEQSVPVKVWLISDMQRSALPAQLNALYAPEVSFWEHYSVVQEPQRNVHLSGSAHSADGVNVQVNLQLRASRAQPDDVTTAADQTAPITTVQVLFEDRVLAEERVQLTAGDIESRVFDGLIMPPGAKPILQVRLLEDDALLEDNQLDLTIRQADPTPVVLLRPDRSARDSAAVFVTTALETDSLARVEPIAGTAERVPPETLHIIAARDLTASSLALDVLQFVDTDGNALVFDNSDSATPNGTDLQGVGIGVIDESHPLGLGQFDWFGTRFYDLAPMALQADDRVLLSTADRQPLLVERPTSRGTLLLLNDRLDGVTSNLPLQPAFVSLMQSVLRYFDASTAIPDQLTVGERLSLPGNVQLLDPDSKPLIALGANAQPGGVSLEQPGIYRVVGARGEHDVRVVLDPGESDLSLVTETELDAWRTRYEDVADTEGASEGVTADPVLLARSSDNERQWLWRWLLPLMVLILLMESALANRRLDVRRDGS